MNLGTSFDKLISFMFIPYGGCKIAREFGGYRIFNQTFTTLDEAKKAIDQRYQFIQNSVK